MSKGEEGVIFVLFKDNKILLQQRDKNCKKFPFKWCIPGGGREENESYEKTLLREIKEEFDMDLNVEQCEYITDYPNNEIRVYLCKINSDQIPTLNEGMAMKWVSIQEIKNMELGFNQDKLILLLESYLEKTNDY